MHTQTDQTFSHAHTLCFLYASHQADSHCLQLDPFQLRSICHHGSENRLFLHHGTRMDSKLKQNRVGNVWSSLALAPQGQWRRTEEGVHTTGTQGSPPTVEAAKDGTWHTTHMGSCSPERQGTQGSWVPSGLHRAHLRTTMMEHLSSLDGRNTPWVSKFTPSGHPMKLASCKCPVHMFFTKMKEFHTPGVP